MSQIDILTNGILAISGTGLIARIIYCIVMIQTNHEEADGYKKRMKNAFIFVAIVISAFTFKEVAMSYYGTSSSAQSQSSVQQHIPSQAYNPTRPSNSAQQSNPVQSYDPVQSNDPIQPHHPSSNNPSPSRNPSKSNQ